MRLIQPDLVYTGARQGKGDSGNSLPVLRSNKRLNHSKGDVAIVETSKGGIVHLERLIGFRAFLQYLLGLRPTGNPVAGATPQTEVGAGFGIGIEKSTRRTRWWATYFVSSAENNWFQLWWAMPTLRTNRHTGIRAYGLTDCIFTQSLHDL
jgi:hypothetical protein